MVLSMAVNPLDD